MIRCLPCLILGLALPMAAAAKGDKPVLITPYEDSPCWVSVFDGKYYRPPAAHLTGPSFLERPTTGPIVEEDLSNVGGQDFIDRIDSLIVGPRARIVVYDKIKFSGNNLAFGPGEWIPDLAAHQFDNRIKSIRVECE